MHRNYFLFKQQVDELSPQIIGQTVRSCFSHRKDEMVVEIGGETRFFLRIGIKPNLPYFLMYPAQNIKDPKAVFFPELKGQTIGGIKLQSFDKHMVFEIGNYELHAVFYGRSPNICLRRKESNFESFFKSSGHCKFDSQHDIRLIPASLSKDELKLLVEKDPLRECTAFFAHHIGGFNTLLARELAHRCNIPQNFPIGNLTDLQFDGVVQKCHEMAGQLSQPQPQITTSESRLQKISLLPLLHLAELNFESEFPSVNEAWKKYIHRHQVTLKNEKLRARLSTLLKRHSGYLQRTLTNIRTAEQLEARDAESKLKGNLLLTFLSEIPPGSKKVKLKNIFSDSQEIVEIKLNPAYSAQENARRYFEKFKHIDRMKENIKVKKDTFSAEFTEIEALLKQVERATRGKQLESIEQECIDRRLIKNTGQEGKSAQSLQFAFNRVLLARKWEIFIGKNAANNDLLTLKFAHKFDIWLHAQGVSGSHVVIRLPAADARPPQQIIEQAAAIAAWYSNARHSTVVPVNYTFARYVRKPRKAPAGAVTISREQTIFVKPQKMS